MLAYGSSKYVQAVVKNIEETLTKEGKSLPTQCMAPLSTDYQPEIGVLTELGDKGVWTYQSLIGILRRIVELGCINICCEVLLMLYHMALDP